ncbi:MAG: hypothetical protein ACR2H5_07820 [Ktedonobacteraceae bacterium]
MIRASYREPDRHAGFGVRLERVGQFAARALAVGSIVAAKYVGLRRYRADHRWVLRATERAASYPAVRGEASRTDDSSPTVG